MALAIANFCVKTCIDSYNNSASSDVDCEALRGLPPSRVTIFRVLFKFTLHDQLGPGCSVPLSGVSPDVYVRLYYKL